ncbi:MAG: tetrahydrofolate dehydrogenase/cyclohydrolase catalytic domain-containing protein, partial [Gaiellaceae bacterium]
MSARVIDGNRLAEELRSEIEEAFRQLGAHGVRPGLATVLAGDDYAAAAYERRVRRLAEEIGCRYTSESLGPYVEQAEALAVVGKLNADPRVSGILILRPL